MKNISKLFTGFTFLRLKSADLVFYQFGMPIIFCVVCQIIYYFVLPVKPSFFGSSGILEDINSLLGTLIGFYIASVAAIASFNNKYLDSLMKGNTPELVYNNTRQKLTRRRFLCVLFGYCACLSLVLYITTMLMNKLFPSMITYDFFCRYFFWFKLVGSSLYLLVIGSLLTVTLLGLHYLIDRMHRI